MGKSLVPFPEKQGKKMKLEGGRMTGDCRPLPFFLTRATKVVRSPSRLPDLWAVKFFIKI